MNALAAVNGLLRCRPRFVRVRFALLGLLVMSMLGMDVVPSMDAAEPPKAAATKQVPAPASPLSPDEALKHFQLDSACRIEIAAAEPQVIDPVDVRFDEDGRMWVVEMRDYPHGPAAGQPPLSRIKILEDRDGDGRFETATVFADKLLFATGVQPWKGGVFVTLAGRVAYMKDTNGDGKADVDETWFTGFAQENSQLRANHPRLALDNHIYVANGLRGGKIVNHRKKPGGTAKGGTPLSKDAKGVDAKGVDAKPEVIDISGLDFRFNPLTGDAEAVSGNGQFGLTFDDYGNRFTCTNRNPLRHVVLEQRYLKMNPLVAVPDVCQDVAKTGEESRLFPISRAWTTSNLHAGQFTAACGVEIYRGDALGKDSEGRSFSGNAFTCDPTGNLVHREIMKPKGATFESQPAYKDREFLASTDEWFRPVNLTLGPDGALYVVDMYRAVIEHPDWVPDELKNRPDMLLGNDRGRVWRITGNKSKPEIRPQLSKAKGEVLVKLLEHPNAWWHEAAQRLIVERQDDAYRPHLQALVRDDSRAALPRIHALWALHGISPADAGTVELALAAKDAHLREQAFLAAEGTSLIKSDALGVAALAAIQSDGMHARLAYQALLSGSVANGYFAAELDRLKQIDVWTRDAVAIAAGPFASEVLKEFLGASATKHPLAPPDDHLTLAIELAKVAKAEQISEILQCIIDLPQVPEWRHVQLMLLETLAKSLPRQRSNLPIEVETLKDRVLQVKTKAVLRRAAEAARAPRASAEMRLQAIALLAWLPEERTTLTELARHEPQPKVRVRAIGALAQHDTIAPWRDLLSSFQADEPCVRRAIVDGMLSRGDRTSLLLDEIAAGRIKPAELDRAHVDRLLKHSDAKIRERAAKLLADAIPADRRKVLAEYQPVLKMTGDAKRGIAIFTKNCATCHRIGDAGVNVAPDISDSRVKTPAQILTDILQPNRAIDSNYVGYNVLTSDGRQLTGIIANESATSVTLKQQEGKTVTLLRTEIDKLQSSGVSLMPEGLEKTIPPQEMADLIAFIKNWRYLDGKTPLGK